MTSNQVTESTTGHYKQGKLKQKMTYNPCMLIDLSQEDKRSLAENLLNICSQGADSFTQKENSLGLPLQISHFWETQNILLSNPAGLETQGIKQKN